MSKLRNTEMAIRGLELPDSQISDAIVQDEWRRALQLIEKREKKLKKDETLDWLTVWKISHVLPQERN